MSASVSNVTTPIRSAVRAGLAVLVIIAGLALRHYGFGVGLPAPIVKYGGSLLWGTMVFVLVGAIAPALRRRDAGLIAAAIAVGVELIRLAHTPWLDAFRLTTAGALLLGRIFTPWNIVAYGGGIVVGILLDRLVMTAVARGGRSSVMAGSRRP